MSKNSVVVEFHPDFIKEYGSDMSIEENKSVLLTRETLKNLEPFLPTYDYISLLTHSKMAERVCAIIKHIPIKRKMRIECSPMDIICYLRYFDKRSGINYFVVGKNDNNAQLSVKMVLVKNKEFISIEFINLVKLLKQNSIEMISSFIPSRIKDFL